MKSLKHISCILITTLIILSCQKEPPVINTGNSITEFYVSSILHYAPIDEYQKTITLRIPANVNLKSITPRIKLSDGATVNPPSGQVVDLSDSFEYTVTAEDGNSKVYTVYSEQYTDTAFLIIDVQNRGVIDAYNCEEVFANINCVASKAREANKPVVYIVNVSDSYTAWELDIAEEIYPQTKDIVISKEGVLDVFDESTRVVTKLNELKIGVVILSGLTSQSCVNESCIGSLNRGYKVIIASDCHTNSGIGDNWVLGELLIEQFNEEWLNLGAILLEAEEIQFN